MKCENLSLLFIFIYEFIGEVGKAYYAARVFCIGTIFMGVCLLAEGGFSSSWLKKRWLISRKEWQKLPGIPVALVCIWSKVMLLIFFIAAIMESIH